MSVVGPKKKQVPYLTDVIRMLIIDVVKNVFWNFKLFMIKNVTLLQSTNTTQQNGKIQKKKNLEKSDRGSS